MLNIISCTHRKRESMKTSKRESDNGRIDNKMDKKRNDNKRNNNRQRYTEN